jgi:hypothetical protein
MFRFFLRLSFYSDSDFFLSCDTCRSRGVNCIFDRRDKHGYRTCAACILRKKPCRGSSLRTSSKKLDFRYEEREEVKQFFEEGLDVSSELVEEWKNDLSEKRDYRLLDSDVIVGRGLRFVGVLGDGFDVPRVYKKLFKRGK